MCIRDRNVTTEKTFALTTGFKGFWGENWSWEAAYNHSQYKADVGMPRINRDAANTFFLGQRLGYDDDGYAIYAPDPNRLFKPLTTAEFSKLAAMSTFRPKAANDNVSFTFDTPVPVSYTHLAKPAAASKPAQAAGDAPITNLQSVQVTGSRIPRAQVELSLIHI